MTEKGERLLFFSGRECPHCAKLRPVVEAVSEEEEVEIEEKEVWHSEQNASLMREYGEAIAEACGGDLGVPSLYNERTGKALCGKIDPESIREWIHEEP
ncbi:MAG: glutaredoxin family protein [Methanomassiliicoccales archaeon]